jgi:riboflavin kinase/FMN adenylyltransferase
MPEVNSIFPFPHLGAPAVTIGNFDGLHTGHRRIFDACVSAAGAGESLVITFSEAPAETMNPDHFRGYLFPPALRERLFLHSGIRHLVELDFPAVRGVTAAGFLSALAEAMPGARLFVGDNFRFGKDNGGNTEFLRNAGEKLGLKVTVIPRSFWNGKAVSSSRIREAVSAGDMDSAAAMLGRPYLFLSTQVPGDRIGRTIGFPTVNLTPGRQVVPADGVYFTLLADLSLPAADRILHPAMTYIGLRPTLNGREMRIETNILELSPDRDRFDSGKPVALVFVKRIRGEKTFPNLEELQKNIYNDRSVVSGLHPQYRVPTEITEILFGG